jgi:O-antigen/teichoic acid export membrane protein
VSGEVEEEGHILRRNDNQLIRRLAGDVLRISTAVGLAQVLALAATPLLTRLYTPEAFGHLAFFSAMLTTLMPLASLRYEWALPLPSHRPAALDLLALCFVVAVGSSLAVALIAPLAWPILSRWTAFGARELMLLPFGVLVLGLHAVVTGWLVRDRAFSQVALVRFATTVGGIACQIVLAAYGDPTSLIAGFLGGYLLGASIGAYHCRRVVAESAARVRLSGLREVAAEYRLFALITAPSGLINAIGAQLPSIVLPSLYGLAVTGQYSLAQRVLSQPIVLVGQAAYQIFWANAARLSVEEPARLWPLFLRLNACLLGVMAPCLALTWLGPTIFGFVFGAAWVEAGSFAGVMVVASFLGLAAQSTTTLEIYRLNHWMAGWELMRLIMMLGALGAAARMMLSPAICIVGITIVLTVSNLVLLGLNALALWRVKFRAEQADHPGGGVPKTPIGRV